MSKEGISKRNIGVLLSFFSLFLLGFLPVISNSRPSNLNALNYAFYLSLWQLICSIPFFIYESTKSIVSMLKDGLSTKDLNSFFNQNYNHHKAPKVKSGRVGISNAIRRIWNKEYDEFKCRAMDEGKWNKLTSPFDYNRLQFTHFYHYLIRIYHLYPKINVELADLITESELSTKEVDKEFLIFLVQIGKGLDEIAEKYNSTYDVFRKWFKRVLGMNYNNAKDEYFWKPKLLPLIKKYDPINAMTNIAKKLNIPDTTIRSVIKRIWKDEFEQFGSLRTLLNYIKNS